MQENKRGISVVKDRIIQYLDFKGITKYAFYKKTGVTNGVLSQPNGISEDNLLRFLSCYDDVSLPWLLTGQGEMLKGEVSKYPEDDKSTGPDLYEIIRSQQETINRQSKIIEALTCK